MTEIQPLWNSIMETLSNLAINTKTLCKQQTQAKVITSKHYREAHDTIFNICSIKDQTIKAPQTLYKKYQELLTTYLLDIIRQLQICQKLIKIKKFREIWNSYKSYMRLLKHLFAYLDRFYIPNNSTLSLEKRGLIIYCETILSSQQSKVVQELYFEQIQNVRKGDYTNAYILRQFIQVFVQIKAKDNNKLVQHTLNAIQAHYISSANEYYKQKFKELEGLPCGQYFKQINILYNKEQQIFDRCYSYQQTKQLLKKEFSNELVIKYNDNLLEKSTGLISMLDNRQVQNLKLLNSIYKKLDCFSETIKNKFKEYFEKELELFLKEKSKILEDLQSSGNAGMFRQKIRTTKIQLVKELFQFNKQKYELFQECFPGNIYFLNLYKIAIKKILNQENQIYNISQILALYSDYILRKKNLEWQEFQEELKQIFIIFSYLRDKDIYIKDYSEYLANRLIKGQSDDDTIDHEKSFISKLKQNCGIVYTSLVENILSDHTISYQENENFKKYLDKKHKISNFQVRVLCSSIWPHEQPFELALPNQLLNFESIFSEYFKGQDIYKYKNFKWDHLMSKVTITVFLNKQIPEQKYQWCDLNMNTLQVCLLYFVYQKRPYKVNQKEILSNFAHIQKKLLMTNLFNLCNNSKQQKQGQPQHYIILRTKDQQTTDIYYEFHSNIVAKRIRIQYGYTKQTTAKKEVEIQNDRGLAIQMAIVKIMKARKRLKFQQLVNQVADQLRNFSPSIKQIKYSIERMLQKDYLQRDAKDISQYRYRQ